MCPSWPKVFRRNFCGYDTRNAVPMTDRKLSFTSNLIEFRRPLSLSSKHQASLVSILEQQSLDLPKSHDGIQIDQKNDTLLAKDVHGCIEDTARC